MSSTPTAIVVEAYNPLWPQHFTTIKSSLLTHLHPVSPHILTIEHVGSTSVPGLAAKPILDIDIIVRTRAHVAPVCTALVETGAFTYLGELGIADRHALRAAEQDPPRNVYVCVDGAAATRNHLGVRRALREDDALRDEYANVKWGLASRVLSLQDYIAGKSAVVQKILRAAGSLSDAELAAVDFSAQSERHAAVRTERLVVREFGMEDVEGVYALEGNDEVVRFQRYGPKTLEQVREDVAGIMRDSVMSPREHVEMAVVFEGRFVGRVGARIERGGDEHSADDHSADNPLTSKPPPRAKLWFSFLPNMQRQGFATEAMRAFIPLLGSPLSLEIECDPRNTGAWKLAERLGFEKVGLTEREFECKGEWVGSVVYGMGV